MMHLLKPSIIPTLHFNNGIAATKPRALNTGTMPNETDKFPPTTALSNACCENKIRTHTLLLSRHLRTTAVAIFEEVITILIIFKSRRGTLGHKKLRWNSWGEYFVSDLYKHFGI